MMEDGAWKDVVVGAGNNVPYSVTVVLPAGAWYPGGVAAEFHKVLGRWMAARSLRNLPYSGGSDEVKRYFAPFRQS